MIDQVINTKDPKKADVVILSAPYEGGVSFMGGTAKAPKKILDCLNNNLELFSIKFLCEPAKKIKTAHLEIAGLRKLSPEKAWKKISTEYKKVLDNKKFPILLGGEHTVSLGALDALSKTETPNTVTILHIDAHQDLRDNNSDYSNKVSKYAHSCAMRRVHELGYPLVQVGIRTFSKYEYEYSKKNKKTIKVFPWIRGIDKPKVAEIIKSIKTKKVYLSLDVDGIDPSFMPGTGTPVQGGLKWNYTLNLIDKLFETKNVIAADIVEVSPMRDSVLTEFGAAQICYNMIAEKFKAKLG
ncbi:MAG: agmatinase [bacterium]|nr:agmatinase [bacterium]